jgi:multidrug efflux system membrane fusion protein
VVAALTAGVMAIAGCEKKEGPPPAAGGFGAAVTAVPAISKDVPVYIDEIGHTTASEAVVIQAQVSGKIMARHFVDGADVKKGDLLFQIDPRPFQASLEQAQGQLAKDQALKSSSDWNVSQDTAALATKAISEQQLHTDTASRDQAAAAIAVDQAAIDYAKLNVEYCSIRSPIDGRAGARLVDVGNVVTATAQAAGTNLLSIQKISPIYADFTINEAQLDMVRHYMASGELQTQVMLPDETAGIIALEEGTTASSPTQPTDGSTGPVTTAPSTTEPTTAPSTQALATTEPATTEPATTKPSTTEPSAAKPHLGKLIFLDNAVQDGTGTVKLRAELSNADHHFWPGQFVNVRLILTIQHGAVLIPTEATQISQQGLYVYVVEPDEKDPQKSVAQQRVVTMGQQHGNLSVVDTGLKAGEQVIVTGQMLVMPGAPVTVINAMKKPMGGPTVRAANPDAVAQKMENKGDGHP